MILNPIQAGVFRVAQGRGGGGGLEGWGFWTK